jgi:hypothetical protein
MRASFSSTNPTNRDTQKPLLVQTLAGAYKLQFRSIQPDNLLVDQVSIVVGGKKIAITEGSFFVPANKGITLSLSLEDTQFIAQHNDATLRFKADNISQLIMIKDHKISEFSLTP